jgi:hypothetical protein
MAYRLLSPALGVALTTVVFVACSSDGSSTDPGAAGQSAEAGANSGASSGGKSGAGAGDSSKAGAGSPGMGGSAGSTGGTPVDDFWQEFAAALCERYFHCPHESEPESHSRLRAEAKTEERCAALLLDRVILPHPRVKALSAGATAGALQLQADQVSGCLATARLCEYPFEEPADGEIQLEDIVTCREVFEGSVAADGACDLDEECEGDAWCAPSDDGACAGSCKPRLADGEVDCTDDRACAAGPNEWAVCSDFECVAYDVGMAADDGTPCATYANQNLCHQDSWCAGELACAPARTLNQSCDPQTVEESLCLEGHCLEATCTAFTVRTQAGGACDAEAQLCDSFASLSCVGGECVAADGENCTTDYWFERALCDAPALRGVGADCTSSNQCESGICRPSTGCAASLCSSP